MRTFYKIVMIAGLTFTAMANPARAQLSGCAIQQASQQALNQKLALIQSAKVNTPDFFGGSCISPNLMKIFDLSSVIPDPASFLASGLQTIAQQAIQQATQFVCNIINQQVSAMLNGINTALSSGIASCAGSLPNFNLTSLSQMSPLSGSFCGTSLSGFGQYQFPSFSQTSFSGLSGSVAQPVIQTQPPVSAPVPPSSSVGGILGQLLGVGGGF